MKTSVFNSVETGMSGFRGHIDIFVPAFSNGELDPKGQILTEASAGYNSDAYHPSWDYRTITYTPGPAR